MAGTGAGEKGLAYFLKKRGARGGVNHSWTNSAPLPSFVFTVSTNACRVHILHLIIAIRPRSKLHMQVYKACNQKRATK